MQPDRAADRLKERRLTFRQRQKRKTLDLEEEYYGGQIPSRV